MFTFRLVIKARETFGGIWSHIYTPFQSIWLAATWCVVSKVNTCIGCGVLSQSPETAQELLKWNDECVQSLSLLFLGLST